MPYYYDNRLTFVGIVLILLCAQNKTKLKKQSQVMQELRRDNLKIDNFLQGHQVRQPLSISI